MRFSISRGVASLAFAFSTFCFLSVPLVRALPETSWFQPEHRLAGIGVDRQDLSDEALAERTDRMIQSQTFTILREPQAIPGAQRMLSPRLQAIFQRAARQSGFPADVLEAVSYLESWGISNAESPAGPKGIMQISEATAKAMGLKVIHRTRYRTRRERVLVKRRGRRKPVYRTVVHRIGYIVTLRDDRLYPERAIPAAARYLEGMEQRFGSQDWAIFAYHGGQGCVSEMLDRTRQAVGRQQASVARMFFENSPAWNRDLYEDIRRQMERDYSPTYWFRVMRARQLLALYREDPVRLREMAREYQNPVTPAVRAPHRLAVWVKPADLIYRTAADLLAESSGLVRAVDHPEFFGYSLRRADGEEGMLDSPAAIGTLMYIAFETRRIFEAAYPGEPFVPLPVTSMAQPSGANGVSRQAELMSHASGQVFDIDYQALPEHERGSLRFILNDLGWEGYLGFVEEGANTLHIGCAPGAREFFTEVFHDAVRELPGAKRPEASTVPEPSE